jgi:hypothetical protein
MATIVFGDDPGPLGCTDEGAHVTVLIRDGEGATAHLTYIDLETLHETVLLFSEARDKLAAAKIRDEGVDVSVEAIAAGDQIAVGDRIREVITVIVRDGAIQLASRDLFNDREGSVVLDHGSPVTRVGPANTPACI